MALRNQLLLGNTISAIAGSLSEKDQRAIADVALGAKTAAAAVFLLDHLQEVSEPRDKLEAALRHIARYAPENQLDRLREFLQGRFDTDLDFQLSLFKSIQEGISRRGASLTPSLRDWGTKLAVELFASVDGQPSDWRYISINGSSSADPWFLEKRRSADGDHKSQFLCSLPPGGEQLTGILRSRQFEIPPQFSFFLAGHDGPPDKPAPGKNLVRLRDAQSDKILASVAPPRNDTAQLLTWDLKDHAGKSGRIEIVDGDDGSAYAWLAIGRFNPSIVPVGGILPKQAERRQQAAADLAGELKIAKLEQSLRSLFLDEEAGIAARGSAAKALMKVNSAAHESNRRNCVRIARARSPRVVCPAPTTSWSKLSPPPRRASKRKSPSRWPGIWKARTRF
jgi:hypothetical protein